MCSYCDVNTRQLLFVRDNRDVLEKLVLGCECVCVFRMGVIIQSI